MHVAAFRTPQRGGKGSSRWSGCDPVAHLRCMTDLVEQAYGGGWAWRVGMVRAGVLMAKTARTEWTGFEAEWICIHGNQVSGPFQVDV